ncbi:hypothetical protein SCMU_25920 [Sinomonas cyclohexanicum]|uniref:Uncharacterized protein n=1 Tax=Sinomonas cyclohexanicum TaxID=322009 RepID=A0ABM7PWU0_SINCY|nr:hypothetical protein SCMU_25920 [Corynebacterium cyclohexanicum]
MCSPVKGTTPCAEIGSGEPEIGPREREIGPREREIGSGRGKARHPLGVPGLEACGWLRV